MSDIDWPQCMDYVEFDYYDTIYNESNVRHTFRAPFKQREEFEMKSDEVACNEDYVYIARVTKSVDVSDCLFIHIP